MAVQYKYSSDCCNHIYMEIRSLDQEQIFTKCNNCAVGTYILIEEIELPVVENA